MWTGDRNQGKEWGDPVNYNINLHHLLPLHCGIQCFERHDGYERFMGKLSCQCIYTYLVSPVQIRVWLVNPGPVSSSSSLLTYGGNGVVF